MTRGRKNHTNIFVRFNHKNLLAISIRLNNGKWVDVFMDSKNSVSHSGTFTIVSSFGFWSANFIGLKKTITSYIMDLSFVELFTQLNAGSCFDLDATIEFYQNQITYNSGPDYSDKLRKCISNELMEIRTACQPYDRVGFIKYVLLYCPHLCFMTQSNPTLIDWVQPEFKSLYDLVWSDFLVFLKAYNND